jgi:hypothetical protein
METFVRARDFVLAPRFERDRQRGLKALDLKKVDSPIRGVIAGFADLSCCFTLQSCYGHFVHAAQPIRDNVEPLPDRDIGSVTYRIAYVAFCIQNNAAGRRLHDALSQVPMIDAGYVQFGSPDWFWERHPNSYALQVEPVRFAAQDQAVLDYQEALHVQKVRGLFFGRLGEIVDSLRNDTRSAS